MHSNTLFKFIRITAMGVAALVALCLQTPGQSGSPTARGFTPGAGYAVSDFENVNLNNGNVMFSFPLAQLPVGRTGLTTGYYLTYNSKLYDTETKYFENGQQQCGAEWDIVMDDREMVFLTCGYYTKQLLTVSEEGGWRYSAGYSIKTEDRSLEYATLPGSQQPSCTGGDGLQLWKYRYKTHVIFPDGSKHEMIPSGYTESGLGDRYFSVNTEGNLVTGCGTGSTVSRPTYYSVDGTYLRMQFNTSVNRWFLYFPDGSYYDFGGGGYYARLYDRNNSYVEFQPGQIVDELGRSVRQGTDTQTGEHTFTVDGFGGADVVKRVKWKNIYVTKNYKPYSQDVLNNCANSRSCPSTQDAESVDKSFSAVDYIELPSQVGQNLRYSFSYNGHSTVPNPVTESVGLGELSGVELPSGAHIEYSYGLDNQTTSSAVMFTKNILMNAITAKSVTYTPEYPGETNSPVTETWQYTIQPELGGGSVTGPDGSTSSEGTWPTGWKSGLSLISTAPDGTKVERLYAQNGPAAAPVEMYATNPYVKAEFTSIKSGTNYTLTAIKEYNYDKNGNVTEVKEYDWMPYSTAYPGGTFPSSVPSGAATYLKRITKTEFYNPTPDATSTTYTDPDSYHAANAPRLLRMPKAAEVQTSSATPVSRSEFLYDGATVLTQNPTVGNLTQTRSWDSTKGGLGSSDSYGSKLYSNNFISTSATYNSYGMPTQTADANGNVSTITYDSTYTLFPVQTVSASGTGVARTSSAQYDFYTGLATTATDNDNNVSTITEYDALGRPTKVRSAANTALESWTVTQYDDTARRVIVKSDLETVGDGRKVAVQHFDQLGRVRLSRTLENPYSESPTNEQHGIKVQTRYKFASGYTYQVTSNPYRAATSSAETDPTMGWTRSKAWSTGIKSEVETFSGSALPAPWGSNSSTTGKVVTDIDANRTLVTDQAGKQRISKTSALGQLTDVWEVKAYDPATVSVTFPGTSIAYGYQTSYAYDTLNNLTTVTQGSQTRTFAYSSLSRLTSAINPESGTVSYLYDNNGNLTRKTDARTVQTNYVYDALNRVTQRSYANDPTYTPTVTYTYDNLTNAKGRLTKVASSVSTTEYTAFDILGRATAHKQTTDGTAYTTGYTYNISGALVEETYPSGRVVKNTRDASGDLQMVQSKKNANYGYWSYADSFSYNAAGAVTSKQLGNGLWESTQFNSRLQPTQIALGAVQNTTDKLKLNYGYGTASNNGNVLSQTITVPGLAQPFIQNYTYDELNRLTSATETNNGSQTWNQVFGYDRFGNRNVTSGVGQTSLTFSNNRITAHSYDAAGNTTNDGSRTFTYDAENKQTAVNNGSTGQYFYDGDGKRVKKVVPGTGETTIFVYDAVGKQIAEYSNVVEPVASAKVSYLINDHLGSPRINTDQNGAVTARHDYRPFGEEIFTVQRTSSLGYNADTVRKQFTGYERDGETDLDYAKARMHDYSLGRFTSPDPFNIVFEKQLDEDPEKGNRQFRNYISKPEQWNRYVYAINNPLKFVDPDGREIRLDSSLTEKERNEILYHLQKLTRDKLNWKTDSSGNVGLVITKTSGAGNDPGTRLIRRLDGYRSVVTITATTGGNSQTSHNTTNESNGIGSDSTVRFNANAAPKIGTLDENTGISRTQDRPAWIGLAHELIHADHAARGTTLIGTGTYSFKDVNGTRQTATANRYELATVGIGGLNNRMDITENQIRRAQGLRVRSEY